MLLHLPVTLLLKWINKVIISVTQLSSSLVSHLYGVFPTHGYENDLRYPDTYNVGEVVLDNLDCAPHASLFCSPHSYVR